MVELFVSIFLTLIIMSVVFSVYRLQTRTLKVQEKRLDAQQYVRSILSLMVREVRNVGHFPVGTCSTTPAHTLGIILADRQSFHFVYDSDDDGDCSDPNENILYSFDTTLAHALSREAELIGQRIERRGLAVREPVAALDHHALPGTQLRQPLLHQRLDLVPRERRLGRRRILRGEPSPCGAVRQGWQ